MKKINHILKTSVIFAYAIIAVITIYYEIQVKMYIKNALIIDTIMIVVMLVGIFRAIVRLKKNTVNEELLMLYDYIDEKHSISENITFVENKIAIDKNYLIEIKAEIKSTKGAYGVLGIMLAFCAILATILSVSGINFVYIILIMLLLLLPFLRVAFYEKSRLGYVESVIDDVIDGQKIIKHQPKKKQKKSKNV